MPLAQFNIAEALAPMDSPVMADFVNNIDRLNALADDHKGFIWRLKSDDADHAYDIQAYENESMIVNMSVWEDKQSLFEFVYQSGHVEIFKRKREWFSKMAKIHMVLWYVDDGHIPTITEGKERLEHLWEHGESKYAFTFKSDY
ncbi:DUF3291 domain-containing protein [Aureisphaera galaxeae]|uniref:DUF3291 domain-containing protein n=1 Tax=Aureisphaera galaxeae TaxID=1538023 RepID=UPI0023508314|nr:DUF3291 domain-containing protein [Aureisphaera galaxeae]MDC8003589.1 DUF3291 domain-containing protein [Aureisphaera galaxeae]